ncbi:MULTISPECIES: alpha/beta hydrolase [Prauserella salsuginis group]|uniref:Serine aminopeptidase S33 domain-containing protein n=2 Tax=Prauserella salsuginis group TaxID=2893672 RepID=A0A839XWS0_9PSEU|nr:MULTISPECIES: alpha/beta hydrolase [Prauserella salsuginis group]MBB3665518.1 hypothetical protein [Prauserella sediminis]MCR3718784.1 hypothetical protein [Prauserella flava]MCR3733354.1 hypothetical protein [Prauserella salsuginis]
MIENKTAFYSEGARLQASFYYPENVPVNVSKPVVIINSGYQGFNEFYPKMFAKRLTSQGFSCFGFDYRGMADSEGEKGTVLIEQQVEDVRNAVTFVQSRDDVDSRQVGLIGWGMGAANVVLAAQQGPRVAAVAALNGFYDGERWLRSVHTYDEWTAILETVRQDRTQRVLCGESALADTFEHYPLDPATKEYVGKELEQVYGFGHPTRLQFTESVISTKVERVVQHLAGTPLFIGHGVHNTLHPMTEAESLFAAAPSPKSFYTIDGRHNDFMYGDHPEFIRLCEHVEEFMTDAFRDSVEPARLVRA